VKTPSKPIVYTEKEPEPIVSFTRVIEIKPSSARFGGWGPKVI